MAKGTEAKREILNKLLSIYKGSFMQDAKTLRIPINEADGPVEIKVTLTAAKDLLSNSHTVSDTIDITPQEKEEVSNLLSSL